MNKQMSEAPVYTTRGQRVIHTRLYFALLNHPLLGVYIYIYKYCMKLDIFIIHIM